MAKYKGVKSFTIEEAHNVTMGQSGTCYVEAGSGAFSPINGKVVVAIQILTDATFSALTAEDSNHCVGSGTSTEHTNDTSLTGVSISAGLTIFGRWTTVDPSAGSVICYLG